ncbi:MAG: DUF4350 domain-containing protein [Acidimicrobiia bacterium]
MSGTGGARGATRVKGAGAWLVLIAGLLLVVLLSGGPTSDTPLDPSSTRNDGAKALVDLVEDFGASVVVTHARSVPENIDRVIVLRDDLSDGQREEIDRWVRGGGTAVVADPKSLLVDHSSFPLLGDTVTRQQCTVTALAGVNSLRTVVDTSQFRIEGDRYCFGNERDAFVVSIAQGQGTIVGLGGPEVFVNEYLGDADNAVLATALLAPRDGLRIAWMAREAGGGGDESLSDLIPGGVKAMLLELVLAFVVFAVARARRLGRPVSEPQAVQIPGSEMVVAVGQLLERAHRRDDAAAAVRRDLRRLVRERYGVPDDAPVETVAAVLAARTGVDPQKVIAALSPEPLGHDDDLVSAARRIEHLREDIS